MSAVTSGLNEPNIERRIEGMEKHYLDKPKRCSMKVSPVRKVKGRIIWEADDNNTKVVGFLPYGFKTGSEYYIWLTNEG